MALLALSLLLASSTQSQTAAVDPDLERVRNEILALRQSLGQVQKRAESTEKEMRALDLQMEILGRELHLELRKQARLDGEKAALEKQVNDLHALRKTHKKQLGKRLATLYRLGSVSYLRLLLSIDRSRNPFEALTMLSYLVGRDARSVARFQENQLRLEKKQVELRSRGLELEEARGVVRSKQAELQRTRERKEVVAAELRNRSEQSERKLVELQEKAERLQRLLTLLYEKQDPSSTQTATIGEFKGALRWPVEGRIVEHFGKQRSEKFATFTVSNGLKIEVSPGAPVTAVFAGTVLYSDWFKGYGNLVIIDHGQRIFSLYGNTLAVTVKAGDVVSGTRQIAVAGENEERTSGYLYFEIREDNRPTDPLSWLR